LQISFVYYVKGLKASIPRLQERAQKEEFMSLRIEKERAGDVVVLQCAGKMVRNEALWLLRDAVIGLPQTRVIVMDLSEVTMLGARGLGMLVFLHNWSSANGMQLKLVNPSGWVRAMLELTGLTSVLNISSVNDVIQIFCNSDRAIGNAQPAAA
jgi:anti-anti-sigma factor